MSGSNYTELVKLDAARKWEYLQRYYAAASRFYPMQEEIVTDEQVAQVIARLKEKPAPCYRQEIHLREWRHWLDKEGTGVDEGCFGFACDDSDWDSVRTPHTVRYIPPQPARFGSSVHDIFSSGEGSDIWKGEYSAWYRCEVELPELPVDRIAYLAFESVNLSSTVWVNENPVMLDHLGLFPYEMEITEELRATRRGVAQIALQAKTVATNKPWMFGQGFASAYYNPPFSKGELGEDWDDEAWAGLAGDGVLRLLNRVHVRDVFVSTEKLGEGEAHLRCRLEVRNHLWERFGGRVRVEISPWVPEEGGFVQVVEQDVEVLPMNRSAVEISFRLEGARVWEVGQPRLYLAHLVLLGADGQPLDDVYESFGVRTVEMKGSHFYVNGQLTYLRGTHELTYHPGESPISPSNTWIVREVLLHQALGANCSRYPSDERVHCKRIAEICDQMGYMLAWAGYFAVWILHPEFELHAERDVPALVRDLRNHPSIILWEMGDEPLMEVHDYRRYRWYEQVYRLVAGEDDTRPIQPAGHFAAEIWEMMRGEMSAAERKQRRDRILRDYPLYSLPNLYWDFHTSPLILPLRTIRETVAEAARAFDGVRPTTFAEFGFDALPAPERQMALNGRHRWGANPYWNRSRAEDDLAWYGRQITAADWRETQAAQALVLLTTIANLRAYPQVFAGFFFMMMVDIQTFLQGLVDAGGAPKLAFFVLQWVLRPFYVSGLQGNTRLFRGAPLAITVSTWGQPLQAASLLAVFRDDNGALLDEAHVDGINIPAGPAHEPVGEVSTVNLPTGLITLEMRLLGADGAELAHTVELFFLEEPLEGTDA